MTEKFADIFGDDEPEAEKPDAKVTPEAAPVESLLLRQIRGFIADGMNAIGELEKDLACEDPKRKKFAADLSSLFTTLLNGGLLSPQEMAGLLGRALEVIFRLPLPLTRYAFDLIESMAGQPLPAEEMRTLRQLLASGESSADTSQEAAPAVAAEKSIEGPLNDEKVMEAWRASVRARDENKFWGNMRKFLPDGTEIHLDGAMGMIDAPGADLFVVFNPYQKSGVDLYFRIAFHVSDGEYDAMSRPLDFMLLKPAHYNRDIAPEARRNFGIGTDVRDLLKVGPIVKGLVERI